MQMAGRCRRELVSKGQCPCPPTSLRDCLVGAAKTMATVLLEWHSTTAVKNRNEIQGPRPSPSISSSRKPLSKANGSQSRPCRLQQTARQALHLSSCIQITPSLPITLRFTTDHHQDLHVSSTRVVLKQPLRQAAQWGGLPCLGHYTHVMGES